MTRAKASEQILEAEVFCAKSWILPLRVALEIPSLATSIPELPC